MTATKAQTEVVPASVAQVENTVDAIANDPATAALLSAATDKISPKARRVFYIVGIALGAVITVAAAVGGTLTGNAAEASTSIGGLALSLSNLLAVLHLNVPATAD